MTKPMKLLILLMTLFGTLGVSGTHFKGGFIEIVSVSGTTVTFRFNGVMDPGSSVLIGGGTFIFSDGTAQNGPFPIEQQTRVGELNLISFTISHTFPSSGHYEVGYGEEFRDGDILNCENSVGTSFYCSMDFLLDALIPNSFPTVDPEVVLFGFAKSPFHNAYTVMDADGDLLTYELVAPLQAKTKEINAFEYPWSSTFYSDFESGGSTGGSVYFDFNMLTGNMIWDAPGDVVSHEGTGIYVIAIRIAEKRRISGNWIRLSSTVVDVNTTISLAAPQNQELSADFPWNLCEAEPPYELVINTDSEVELDVHLPFLTLENGESANTLDGIFLSESTTFLLYPDEAYSQPGFSQGKVFLKSGTRQAKYNTLYSTDCDQLSEYELITAIPSEPGTIYIYPNPSTGTFFIEGITGSRMHLLDVAGQVIVASSMKSQQVQLPESIRDGVYIFQLFDEGRLISSERIVVKK